MKIVVIIVTYNGMRWIDHCLSSLMNSSIPLYPIVVDNCSSDNTIQYVREQYPQVELIESHNNIGFGQANNLGIKRGLQCNADYFFLLNQDAWIEKDTIGNLMREIDDQSIITPIHLNGTGDRIDLNFKAAAFAKMDNNLIDDIYLSKSLGRYEINFANAACWLLPRNIILNIGGFNPLFFHYGEDNNYMQRVKYHGYHLYLAPSAKIYHDREQFGNATLFTATKLYRDLLLVGCNINWSFMGRYLRLFKRVNNHLFVYRDASFISSFHAIVQYIKSMPKVRQSRRKEKCCSNTWL